MKVDIAFFSMDRCGDNGIPCCAAGSFYSLVFEHCVTCAEQCPFQKRHTLECVEHCSSKYVRIEKNYSGHEMLHFN